MKRAIPLYMLLVLVPTLLGACHRISHGTVVNKHVHPAHRNTVFIPVSTGKVRTMVPVIYRYPESYSVDVKGRAQDGREVVERFFVSRTEFDELGLGDTYVCGEQQGCVTNPPRERVRNND